MKRVIIGLIILSFIFLTIKANIPYNDTGNVKNQISNSNSSLLTDVQMAMVNGGSIWACAKAVVGWLVSMGAVGAACGTVIGLAVAAAAAGIAWSNMLNNC